MEILRVYGGGPNLQRLLQRFWNKQVVFFKARKFSEWPFGTERGVTKGDPVSPTIFNILMVAVVRAVMLEVCGPQESHQGLVWAVSEHNIVLYVDDGCIVGSNPIWVNMTLTEVVRMFNRVVLLTNLDNTKEIMCTPGFIWGQ